MDIKINTTCINLEIMGNLRNQLRDKILYNMILDDVNLAAVNKYICTCSIDQLLKLHQIAEVLDDWQLIGRIIGNAVEQFKEKD